MSADAEILGRLSRVEGEWKRAEAAGGGGVPPDGDYIGTVSRFDFPVSEHSGLQLETELEVTEGDHAQKTVRIWHEMEDPERLKYLKGHLAKLGLDVEQVTLQALYTNPQHLEGLLDLPVEFRIKTKQGRERNFTNVYVRKVLGQPRSDVPFDEVDLPPTSTASQADDEIPF